MKKVLSIVLAFVALFTFVIPATAYTGFPTFSIESVVQDKTVTIKTNNLPPDDSFIVTMGKIGTRGINGIKVDTTNSGSGGTLTITYTIPEALTGLSQIAIRLQSPTTGYFAYNWFFNTTATITPEPTQSATPTVSPTATPTPAPTTPGYSGFPTFTITTVVRDTSVTISGKNFPPNDTFNVFMGEIGTRGVGGVKIGTTDSGAGGALTATYSIPASLSGKSLIAIRLESPKSGFFSYNWFWNFSTNP